MSQSPVSKRCSPSCRREGRNRPLPACPWVNAGAPAQHLGCSQLGAPEPRDICHSAALFAGPCHQPCTGIGLCQVQHYKALGSPFPPSPLPTSLCSSLAFSLLSPHPYSLPRGSLSVHLEPLSLAAAPRVTHRGPPVSPGSGKWRSFAPWSVERAELPPRRFQPNRALLIPTSSLKTCYATPAILDKCSCSIYLPGCRGFQAGSLEPFPSIHMLEARLNRLCGE